MEAARPFVIDVLDGFTGTRVTCSTEYWDDHEAKHPEMAGAQGVVARILEEPLAVYRSGPPRENSGRFIFYRPSELKPPFDRNYVRVVVGFSGEGEQRRGILLTAFHVTGPSAAETLVWP